MSREEILDSIVRRCLRGLLARCHRYGVDKVMANAKRRGGAVSIVRQAWRAQSAGHGA